MTGAYDASLYMLGVQCGQIEFCAPPDKGSYTISAVRDVDILLRYSWFIIIRICKWRFALQYLCLLRFVLLIIIDLKHITCTSQLPDHHAAVYRNLPTGHRKSMLRSKMQWCHRGEDSLIALGSVDFEVR